MLSLDYIHARIKVNDVEFMRDYIQRDTLILEPRYLRWGRSVMHIAAIYGRDEIVSILATASNVLVNGCIEETPLEFAVREGHVSTVTLLISFGANTQRTSGRSLLSLAAENGYDEIIEILVKANPKLVTECNEDEMPPLHCAARMEHISTIELLVRLGCSLTETDQYGKTPLHAAGSIHVIDTLLNLGAPIDIKSDHGLTPMQEAILYNHDDVVEFLYERGSETLETQDLICCAAIISFHKTFDMAAGLGYKIKNYDEVINVLRTISKNDIENDEGWDNDGTYIKSNNKTIAALFTLIIPLEYLEHLTEYRGFAKVQAFLEDENFCSERRYHAFFAESLVRRLLREDRRLTQQRQVLTRKQIK